MIHKNYSPLFVIVLLFLFEGGFSVVSADEFEMKLRKQAGMFLNSLDEKQVSACVQKMDAKSRWHKQYTGGKREGVQIKNLNIAQKKAMESLFRMVLSDYGWKMAEAIAKQDGEQGLNKYYVACFGDPRKVGAPFALRLCEHHLTVVNFEVADGKMTEFGPILLGANPPSLWLDDEAILMKTWKQQIEKNGQAGLFEAGRGVASKMMDMKQGVLFSSLSVEAQATLKKAWEMRLKIFTPVIKTRLNALHKARGGWKKSRVAFYNNAADKRCKDGGKWDFKCGLPGMVWDYEGSRGHIHLSLCIHPEGGVEK